MTIFYDPEKRQPKVWVIPAFILITLVVVGGVLLWGQQQVEKRKSEVPAEMQHDIFK